jgi:sec-independent protein translocase protein TatA
MDITRRSGIQARAYGPQEEFTAMPNIGVPELVIVLIIIVIIFGVGKLPEIGGALGKGIREFKTESTDESKPEDTKIDAGTSTTASTLTSTSKKSEEKVPTGVGSRADEI